MRYAAIMLEAKAEFDAWAARALPERVHAAHRNSTRHNTEKTHCPHGHPYSGANLYTEPKSGKRYCRTCRHEQWARAYQSRRRRFA